MRVAASNIESFDSHLENYIWNDAINGSSLFGGSITKLLFMDSNNEERLLPLFICFLEVLFWASIVKSLKNFLQWINTIIREKNQNQN